MEYSQKHSTTSLYPKLPSVQSDAQVIPRNHNVNSIGLGCRPQENSSNGAVQIKAVDARNGLPHKRERKFRNVDALVSMRAVHLS